MTYEDKASYDSTPLYTSKMRLKRTLHELQRCALKNAPQKQNLPTVNPEKLRRIFEATVNLQNLAIVNPEKLQGFV